ncbi:MAG: hypothetical protein AAGF22_13145, partial [Pseudomonadota bacterium]
HSNDPQGQDALRLGPELTAEDEASVDATGDQAPFIDSVADKPETKVLFKLKANKPPAEIPNDLELSDLRSTLAPEGQPPAHQTDDQPEAPASTNGGPLRALGAMFKRGGANDAEEDASAPIPLPLTNEAAKPASPRPTPVDPPAQAAPEPEPESKPARGGILRVIGSGQPEETSDVPPPAANNDAEPAAALSGLRGLLSGKSEEQTAPPAEPAADRQRKPEGPSIEDRLHASFTSSQKPATGPVFNLDPLPGEDDEFTPRGFARKIGATTLPDLMGAASAFLVLVEDRGTVSRNDIMDMVKILAGDTPLTAETKIKAFGKLVRSGDLIRVEAGQFAMSPEARARYSALFNEDGGDVDDLGESAL